MIKLSAIVFDAGTQIREAISQPIVTEYAERMSEGEAFPPIVVFTDGTTRADGTPIYYLADGFHRALASRTVGFVDIEADVKTGTKVDALWYALGANVKNGHRMTPADKRHAIVLALHAWPEKSAVTIAKQIGCSNVWVSKVKTEVLTTSSLPDRVTGKDGKSYPASYRPKPNPKRQAIAAMLQQGAETAAIRAALSVSPTTITDVRRELGINQQLDRTPAAKFQRIDRMRAMAAEGYTSSQIAADVGMSAHGCRARLRKEQIDVPADLAVGKTHRHNSTRIVEHMVMDAEHLTADVGLIVFTDLDPARLAEWLTSLKASRDQLGEFIRRLMKEQQKHGQAA